VALHVIASRGFHDTSLREIAETVGLTPAGVLYHFDSKDELFEAILRKRDEHDDAVSDDLSAVLRLRKVIEHNPSVPGLVQLFAGFSTEAALDPTHSANAYFRGRYRSFIARMAASIRVEQQAKTMRADIDADQVASMIVAMADGMQTQWLLDPTYDMVAHLDALLRMITVEPSRESADTSVIRE
jgi:AcrR family transcriptional regulator